MGWALWQKKKKSIKGQYPLTFDPSCGRGQKSDTLQWNSVFSAPAGGASYQRTASYSKNFPSHQRADWQTSSTHLPLPWLRFLPWLKDILTCSSGVHLPNAAAPIPASALAMKEGNYQLEPGTPIALAIYLDSSCHPTIHWNYLVGNRKKTQWSVGWIKSCLLGDHPWALATDLVYWVVLKNQLYGLNNGNGGWITMNKSLWGQELWKEIWAHKSLSCFPCPCP